MVMLKRRFPLFSHSSAETVASIGYEALRFLSEQELEHSPANYALAYAKADRLGTVAMAVNAIVSDGRMLTQADVDSIMAAEARLAGGSANSSDPQQDALRHQTLRLADLTAGAATQSSEFGRDLSAGLIDLANGDDSIEQIVTAMVQRTRGVEEKLSAASREIEDLRQQVETTRHDARRDALTGLLNRRGVLHGWSDLGSFGQGIVAMADIDHFKSINDRFGHGVGDRVLKTVAGSLEQSIDPHMIGRWGGEEFLILLADIDMIGASQILERAREELASRSFKVRGTDESLGAVTVSIGVASIACGKIEEAIEAADRMLYAAKGNGRNRVEIDHGPEALA